MLNGRIKGRRTKVTLWLGGTIVILGTLLYFEQIALIYILSTLALILLLLLVAFSDLGKIGESAQQEAFDVEEDFGPMRRTAAGSARPKRERALVE